MRLLSMRLRVALGGFLLGATTLAFAESEDRVDFKHMYYWDKNKVWNHTPTLSFLKSLSLRWKLQWNQEFDVVSGASRRLGLYNVGRQGDHDLTADGISGASQREMRHSEQVAVAYSDRGRQASASFYFSDEDDYTSYSPSVSGALDFNERNTTLGGQLAVFFDNLHPKGQFKGLGGDRTLVSGTVSLTQIVSRSSHVSMTANAIHSSGALGHPYNPVIAFDGSMRVENLPREKTSFAWAGQWVQGYEWGDLRGAFHFNGRYYFDTWDLKSETGEVAWYQYWTEDGYVRLRARLYHQGPAAFAKDAYAGNEVYRTADIRFYGFTSATLGAKVVMPFPDSWSQSAWLPDRWDLGYDHGLRDTHGELGTGKPTTHYQLFPHTETYVQGIFMAGLSFDL
jgi:Protein of unknown function (DUF3570)